MGRATNPPLYVGNTTLPVVYLQAFEAVDPSGTGEVSVNALIRVLSTSGLPSSTIDRVIVPQSPIPVALQCILAYYR